MNLFSLLLVALLLNTGCTKSQTAGEANFNAREVKVSEMNQALQSMADEIQANLGPKCFNSSECRVAGIGAKRCGEYGDYIVYSVTNVNEPKLLKLIRAFNEADEKFSNLLLNSPNCGKPPKPAQCVNHTCTVQ